MNDATNRAAQPSARHKRPVAALASTAFFFVCADTAGAREVAEAIRTAVAALQIPHAASATGTVTISLGAATIHPAPADSGDASALIRQADALLYQSKSGGRNRVTS